MLSTKRILEIWPLPPDTYTLTQLTSGHINTTWKLSGQHNAYIVQQLHTIFDPRVCLDANTIAEAISHTIHMPRYLLTTANTLWHTDEHGVIWRLMTYLPYAMLDTLESSQQAYSAGHLVGTYHAAVHNQRIQLQAPDLHLHDPLQREQQLQEALRTHHNHPFHDRVTALAKQLGPAHELAHMPQRLCHGDLKITNLLWDKTQAKAIIDLDTFAYMPLAYELGDAFRSWCNPSNETVEGSRFDADLFLAGMTGCRDGLRLGEPNTHRAHARTAPGNTPTEKPRTAFSTDELCSVLDGIDIITKELCMRFLADTLNESYFGWNHTRYPSAAAHNWDRAQSQWNLLQSFRSQKEILTHKLQALFKQKITS